MTLFQTFSDTTLEVLWKKAWRGLEFRQLGRVTIEKDTEIIQGSKERVSKAVTVGVKRKGADKEIAIQGVRKLELGLAIKGIVKRRRLSKNSQITDLGCVKNTLLTSSLSVYDVILLSTFCR